MPVHDWTHVSAGTFHDFHCTWIPLIWVELGDDSYAMPADSPLTLAYSAGEIPRAYIRPLAAGGHLSPMPLFLTVDNYVSFPLEETYQAAYDRVPQRWRSVLDPA